MFRIKKQKKDQAFYVHVENPVYLRRELLLCRKQLLQILHKNLHIQGLRKFREQHTEELRKKIKDIYYLNNKLRALLPVAYLRDYKEVPIEQEPRHEHKESRDLIDEEFRHMQNIEAELKDIESRLSRM